MAKCGRCEEIKDNSFFSKNKSNKNGLTSWCKLCAKEYYLENKKELNNKNNQYYADNADKIKSHNKKYKENNKEYYQEYFKNYYLENKEELSKYKHDNYLENREEILEKSKQYRKHNEEYYLNYLKNWRQENKDYAKEYLKGWLIENPNKRKEYWNKLRIENPHVVAWRKCLLLAIKRIGGVKEKSTIEILGYTADDLKNHMENLFETGVSWGNWGEWHIDHRMPVSRFTKDTPMSIVNSLDNLQPLWAKDNLSKSNKI